MARVSQIIAVSVLIVMSTAYAQAAGALAVGSCGAYGESHDFPNVTAARARALHECKGQGCKVVVNLRGNCAAYAVDSANPCGASAFSSGSHLGKAQNAALRSCYSQGGKDCVIRVFVCDGR